MVYHVSLCVLMMSNEVKLHFHMLGIYIWSFLKFQFKPFEPYFSIYLPLYYSFVRVLLFISLAFIKTQWTTNPISIWDLSLCTLMQNDIYFLAPHLYYVPQASCNHCLNLNSCFLKLVASSLIHPLTILSIINLAGHSKKPNLLPHP